MERRRKEGRVGRPLEVVANSPSTPAPSPAEPHPNPTACIPNPHHSNLAGLMEKYVNFCERQKKKNYI